MRSWMQRGWLARMLWPIAQLFGVVIALRTFLYRNGWLPQHKLPVPVIVVGNIFIGGTGKTPLTLWLLDQFKKAGYKPGVISRGYGRKHDAPCVVYADSPVAQVGDEPALIAEQSACPVVVGRNRVEAGHHLLAIFPDVNVIISDDGLQHLALARDVEIMLFDSRGIGNGWLLPAGPLREPATRRCDIKVANLSAGERGTLPIDAVRMQLKGNRAQRLLGVDQTQELNSIDSKLTIVAAAGIGNPDRFFAMLRRQGVRCSRTLSLPDHFDYVSNPFKEVDADMILITEKDAVKCRQSEDIANDPRIWVVPVTAELNAIVMEVILEKMQESRKNG